jgi:hypothetical protein
MFHFLNYANFDRLPWELGYPHYLEFQNIFPFMLKEWNKKLKIDAETEALHKKNVGSR